MFCGSSGVWYRALWLYSCTAKAVSNSPSFCLTLPDARISGRKHLNRSKVKIFHFNREEGLDVYVLNFPSWELVYTKHLLFHKDFVRYKKHLINLRFMAPPFQRASNLTEKKDKQADAITVYGSKCHTRGKCQKLPELRE